MKESIKDSLTPQQLEIYLTLKAKKQKGGVPFSDMLEAHESINKTRMSDLLKLLIIKGAVKKLERARYQVTDLK